MTEKKFRCDVSRKVSSSATAKTKQHKCSNKLERIKQQTPYSNRTCMTMSSKQNVTNRVTWTTLLCQTRARASAKREFANGQKQTTTTRRRRRRRRNARFARHQRALYTHRCMHSNRASKERVIVSSALCVCGTKTTDCETAQKTSRDNAQRTNESRSWARHITCNSTRTRKQVSPHKRCVALQADRETRNNDACRIVEQRRTNKLRNRSTTIAQRQRLEIILQRKTAWRIDAILRV